MQWFLTVQPIIIPPMRTAFKPHHAAAQCASMIPQLQMPASSSVAAHRTPEVFAQAAVTRSLVLLALVMEDAGAEKAPPIPMVISHGAASNMMPPVTGSQTSSRTCLTKVYTPDAMTKFLSL